MSNEGLCKGQQMNVLAIAFANAIASDLTAEQADYLSAFIQLVGEALANISAAEALCSSNDNNSNDNIIVD